VNAFSYFKYGSNINCHEKEFPNKFSAKISEYLKNLRSMTLQELGLLQPRRLLLKII
jgi:hypothetical protein